MSVIASLTQIMKALPTDKVANGLAQYYDELFYDLRFKAINLLEIGVAEGGSIIGWLEYFPHATIYGVDCRKESIQQTIRLPSPELGRGNLIYGDITSDATLGGICEQMADEGFDIIIDDGSHINVDVFIAFERLWEVLNPGGYYIVEDIQVPYRNPDFPAIPAYFINFCVEHDIKEAEFKVNVLWIRKPHEKID